MIRIYVNKNCLSRVFVNNLAILNRGNLGAVMVHLAIHHQAVVDQPGEHPALGGALFLADSSIFPDRAASESGSRQ